jgi:hypothetical protein
MILALPTIPDQQLIIDRLLFRLNREIETLNIYLDSYSKDNNTGREYLGWVEAINNLCSHLQGKPEKISIDFSSLSPHHRDLVITLLDNLSSRFASYIQQDLAADPEADNTEALTKNLEVLKTTNDQIRQFRREHKLTWLSSLEAL